MTSLNIVRLGLKQTKNIEASLKLKYLVFVALAWLDLAVLLTESRDERKLRFFVSIYG